MAIWVNAAKRLPDKEQRYFVKVNGVRDIYSRGEIASKLERLAREDKILWLDETKQLPDLETTTVIEKFVPKIVERVVYREVGGNGSGSDYVAELRKIFGCEK